jgi:hypothetical protein
MKRVEDRFNCVLASQISFARIDTFVDAFVNAEKSGEFFCVLSKHVYQGASLKMFKLNHSLNVSFFLTLHRAVKKEDAIFMQKPLYTRNNGKPGWSMEFIPQIGMEFPRKFPELHT